jgi:hypothetical protein
MIFSFDVTDTSESKVMHAMKYKTTLSWALVAHICSPSASEAKIRIVV